VFISILLLLSLKLFCILEKKDKIIFTTISVYPSVMKVLKFATIELAACDLKKFSLPGNGLTEDCGL